MPITGSQPALMFCQSGVERCGATRSNYHSSKSFLAIAGVQYGDAPASAKNRVLLESLEIRDVLNEVPNTCRFTTRGVIPTALQEVILTLGSTNNADRLFAGHILMVTTRSVGTKPTTGNTRYDVYAVDYTWQFNRRKVTKRYRNQSATAIALDLVASFTTGFTSTAVQAGLATVDEISFTNVNAMDAVAQLAKRIGGYCFVDYQKVLHLFTTDTTVTNPTDLTSAHASLEAIEITRDGGQLATREYFEGDGAAVIAECAVGGTTIPVNDVSRFQSAGGTVVSGPQRITYTGITEAQPGSAPTVLDTLGLGIDAGDHGYAFGFVSAAGETVPSPTATRTIGNPVANPTVAPYALAAVPLTSGNLTIGATYKYKYSFHCGVSPTTAGQETLASPASTGYVATSTAVTMSLTNHIDVDRMFNPNGPDPDQVTWLKGYRTLANGSVYYYVGATPWNSSQPRGFTDDLSDAAISGNPTESLTNDTVFGRATVSTIVPGPGGTTARKVYRTTAGGSQLKLLGTIADNTTTTYADTAADTALGADAPTVDTSALTVDALTTTSGVTSAGATTLNVASAAAFQNSGIAILGTNPIGVTYTGKTGTSLTGIPATGNGSIKTAIPSATTVQAASVLTGIPASGTGSILYTIQPGDAVNLFVQVDDAAAQAAIVALIGGVEDGIIEDDQQDRRMSYAEAVARATAWLELRNQIDTSLRYRVRDINTRSGRDITASLAAPISAAGTFKIQDVTIAQFLPGQFPIYTASASNRRFAFEDLLRMIRSVSGA